MTKTKRTLITMIKQTLAFLSITMVVFLASCNKSADFEDLELLTDKNWQLITRTQDGTNIARDCDLDDLLIFEDAKNFSYNYGALNCPEENLNKVADAWNIIEDFTVLRMKYKFSGNGLGSLVEYWKIVELSETILILEDAAAEENDQIPEIRTYRN